MKRNRSILNRAACVLLASAWAMTSSPAAAATHPNIIFVLFDDMGYGQPQSYDEHSALRTPNLDRLAAEGMRFTDAHSASGVCTPTRYGVLTGRYPSRIGQFGVLTTYSQPIIPPSRLTVASLLKQNGYQTACIGKWHLGVNWVNGTPGNQKVVPVGEKITGGPNALGFDYFYGYTHARNIGTIIEQDQVVANVTEVENQPLMINKAVEWIAGRAKSDKPFFLYFPMCPPHTPIVPAPNFVGASGAQDLVLKDPKYGDWVYQGDAMLGRILEALELNKLADKTLVIATADNGAAGRTYEPLRASKASIYEGGHRVPFVIRWPGKVTPGSINDHTVCLNDLLATAAEVVGAKLPDDAGEDSVSLLSELIGCKSAQTREATVHQSAAGDLAVRQGPWKLVFLKGGKRELYNLEADISETKNVFSEQAEVATKLTALMQAYIERGRSTPGAPQKNGFALTLPAEDGEATGKRKSKAKRKLDKQSEAGIKPERDRRRETNLAADPLFD